MASRFALWVFLLCGSGNCGTVKPVPTPSAPCAGVACTCADLCDHRGRLGCSTAEPTPGGKTCLDVCRNATDPAGPVMWDLGCRAHAETCEEVNCP